MALINASQLLSRTINSSETTALSPPGVSTLLALTYLGSTGENKKEMSKILGFSDDNTMLAELDEYVKLTEKDPSLKNFFGFYVEKSFKLKEEYQKTISKYGDIKDIEFSDKGVEMINNIVEQKTDGLIKKLLPNGSLKKIVFLLLNTLLCKIKFCEPFNKSITKGKSFTQLNGNTKTVQMMYQHFEIGYKYMEDDKYQIIELKCVETESVLGIVLPKQNKSIVNFLFNGSSNKKKAIKESFHIDPLTIKPKHAYVDLHLPKFTIDFTHDNLVQHFKQNGLIKPFKNNESYCKISHRSDLYIGFIKQKVHIEVDEDGAIDAATVLGMMCESLCIDETPTVVMNCNRTFTGYIRNGKYVLFRFTFDG